MDGKEQDAESLEDDESREVLVDCLLHLRVLLLVCLGEDGEVEGPGKQREVAAQLVE